MHKIKFFSLLDRKDLVIIFFHSPAKPTSFKAYRVPSLNVLPFPSTSGNLFFTTCLLSDVEHFFSNLTKELFVIAVWSGRDSSWVKPEYFSFFSSYEKLKLFSLLFIFKFVV